MGGGNIICIHFCIQFNLVTIDGDSENIDNEIN